MNSMEASIGVQARGEFQIQVDDRVYPVERVCLKRIALHRTQTTLLHSSALRKHLIKFYATMSDKKHSKTLFILIKNTYITCGFILAILLIIIDDN